MKKEDHGTFIDGIAVSENIDSSGEKIIVSGMDISRLTVDGVLNYEHKNDHSSQIVGKILYAKKIYSEDDCSTEREKYFWNKVKIPYIYIIGELFDHVGHSGAKDIVAMLKYDKKNKDKLDKKLINFSVEGSYLDVKNGIVKKSIARKVTITITPCNKAAEAEMVDKKDIKDFVKMNKCEVEFCNLTKSEKDSIIKVPAKEMVEEHKRLVNVLESPSHKDDLKEAKEQKEELQEYKKKLKDSKKKKIKKPKKKQKLKKSLVNFIEKIKNEFDSFQRRKDIDRTAKMMQQQREEAGQEFDPDKTVIADKDKVLVDASKEQKEMTTDAPRALDEERRKFLEEEVNFKPPHVMQQEKEQKLVSDVAMQREGMGLEDVDEDEDTQKIVKGEILKNAMNEAFVRFEKKEELAEYLTMKFPTMDSNEKLVLAKAIAYFSELKKEKQMKDLVFSLEKALSLGSFDAAPSTLTQGAALQVEDLAKKPEKVVMDSDKKIKKKKKKKKKDDKISQ